GSAVYIPSDIFVTILFFFFLLRPRPPTSTLFPYTTLFRSLTAQGAEDGVRGDRPDDSRNRAGERPLQSGNPAAGGQRAPERDDRSEEHTSELQSRFDLVCRLLLEKKKKEYGIPQATEATTG